MLPSIKEKFFAFVKKIKIKYIIKSNMSLLQYESDLYRGRQVALLTQHGKEHVVGPLLDAELGCRVERVAGYNTDLLGTFARDIPRAGTQIEAARKKAHIGMELSGLPIGLASEGSFGPDPYTGMLPWNVEYLVWIDNENGLEVTAVAQGKSNLAHTLTTSWEEAEAFAQKAGFPEHYLVIRPEGENDTRIRKGIDDWDKLREVFDWALDTSENGSVFIETDMRAHANPTRMNNIRTAAQELANKLSSTCPSCRAPGYWIIERLTGLPCKACGEPTLETLAEVHGCCKCTHRNTLKRSNKMYADPGHCEYCNP